MKDIKDYFISILNENTFVLDEVSLNKYFDEFNKKYFDNKLNKPELVIIDNKNVSFIGNHSFIINPVKECIDCNKLIINKAKIQTFDDFRNALVHEMIHNYVNLKNQPKQNQWDLLNIQFTLEELKDKNNLKEIYDILNVNENQNHNGLWKKMANELNINNDELNIEETKGNFVLDENYINKYIDKFAVYYVNQSLFILDKKESYYIKCNELIKKGTCKIPIYEGDWYELELTKDTYLFGLFIKFNNFTKANRYNLTEKQFKMFEHDGCYTTKFLGNVKLSLTEQHRWSFNDLTIEEKQKLTDFFKHHPLMDED